MAYELDIYYDLWELDRILDRLWDKLNEEKINEVK